LNAVAYSLLFPLLLYLLGRRLCDEATARVALLIAAVPPFLVTKWSSLAEPHFETNSFGLLLLLLAVAALRAEPGGARQARLLGCFGLTGGLAWWTNFKALEILLPALLVLWLRDRRLPLRRAGALLAAGFLLGSLPVWLFYATHGHDAGARAAQLFEPGSAASLDRAVRLVTTVLPTLLGTYYWPPDTLPAGPPCS
jgi:peptidoglycan/LPS O-acetylase OafA/YrhL